MLVCRRHWEHSNTCPSHNRTKPEGRGTYDDPRSTHPVEDQSRNPRNQPVAHCSGNGEHHSLRVPVTPLIRAELTRQSVTRLALHAYELTSNPRGREFTAWLDDIAAPHHRTGVALQRSA